MSPVRAAETEVSMFPVAWLGVELTVIPSVKLEFVAYVKKSSVVDQL